MASSVFTIESEGCENLRYRVHLVLVQIGQGKVSHHLGVFSALSTNEDRSPRKIVGFPSRAQGKKLHFCQRATVQLQQIQLSAENLEIGIMSGYEFNERL